MSKDLSKIQAGPVGLTFNSVDIGHTQEGVTLGYEPELRERMVDQFGTSPVDLVLVGEHLSVTVRITQYELANIKIAYPAGLDGTTYLGIGRKPGFELRSVAKALVLHPLENIASDTTEDVTLWKAVVNSPVELGFNNEGDRVFEVTFLALVDDTKEDGNLLGKIGQS